MLGAQLRVLMFVLLVPFGAVIPLYGFDLLVALYAIVAMFLSLAVSWCDAHDR